MKKYLNTKLFWHVSELHFIFCEKCKNIIDGFHIVVGASGSRADVAGLQLGDYIVRINGQNVSRSTANSVARIVRYVH